MPIFEYICKKCGEQFEKLQLSASAKTTCPKCASEKVERQLSRFAASVKEGGCPERATCPGAVSGGCGCKHGGCGH